MNNHFLHISYTPDIEWIRLCLLLELCWKNKYLHRRHDVLPEVNNVKDVLHKEEVAMAHDGISRELRDKSPTITAEYDYIVLV